MELSEKKSKILVNPKKSDLMKESIREMLRLEVQNLQEKAKKTNNDTEPSRKNKETQETKRQQHKPNNIKKYEEQSNK